MKPQGHIPPSASPSAHEAADLNIPLIARIMVILLATLVALVLLVVFLFHHFNHKYPGRTSQAAPIVTAGELPPLPRLQTDPRHDLQEVRATENLHLDRYAWIDRSQGIAQIPIARAMVLWVKNYAPPANVTPASTNSAPTKLEMRPPKATETPHAP